MNSRGKVVAFLGSALALGATLITYFVFFTGKNLPDVVGANLEPTSQVPQDTSDSVTAIAPIEPSGSDEQEGSRNGTAGDSTNWSGQIDVRKPTLNEIREEDPVSLWDWNLIEVQDMTEPGIDTYSGKAKFAEEYLFPVFWCSTSTELLVKNMDHIETSIFVNDEEVPEKFLFIFDFETSSGWVCRYHAVILSEWTRGVQYELDIRRIFREDLFDGESTYSAGVYTYRLILDIE